MKFVSSFFLLLLLPTLLVAQRDSLDIKIGQMVLIGYPGPELDTSVLNAIKSGKAGSIILFEKNVPKSATAFAPLKKVLWTYQKAAPIPLLIAIDQEGGRVNRLKDKYGFPRSITATAMGKANTLDSVRFYAEAIASNLAGLGFNVNFAPVVDVGTNPNNPVIVKAGRSFSANPDSVTLLAREYILPHRKYGVVTALKHFPGHGSSEADTHYGIADVTKTWNATELKPYRELISGGYADAVMSAHIVNKTLDPKGLPGTLSKRILDSLLRKNLGFDGVVFSDDMHMHAITKHFGMEEAIKLAVNAGIDILCFSNNIQNSEESTATTVHNAIRKMVLNGQISRERIDQSYRRIIRLKNKLSQSQAEVNRLEAVHQQQRAVNAERQLDELRKQQAVVTPALPPSPEPETKKSKKRKKN